MSESIGEIVFIWARDLRIDTVYAIGLLNRNGDAVLTDQEGHAALIARLDEEDSQNPWRMLDVTNSIPQRTNRAGMLAEINDPAEPVPGPAFATATRSTSLAAPYRPRARGQGAPVDSNRFIDPTERFDRPGSQGPSMNPHKQHVYEGFCNSWTSSIIAVAPEEFVL